MKIKRLYIKSFGSLADRELSLSDGINVIFGNNETGKSTFLSFFRFIFFGAKKQRGKELSFRDKYMPWDGSDMSGEIEFSMNGADYSLSRTVSASGRKKSAVLINKTTGDTLDIDGDEIGKELFGISEQAFLKTLFLGAEGAQITSDGEILTKISNVAKSGDDKVSYQTICDSINNSVAELSSPRRAKAVIPSLEKKILSLTEKKRCAEEALAQKQSLNERLAVVEASLEKALKKKAELAEKAELSRKYEDYSAYKKCADSLSRAEAEYNEALVGFNENSGKYDFLDNVSEKDEEIILRDTSEKQNEAKMQRLILEDKKKSRFKLSVAAFIVALAGCALGFFSPWLFIAAFAGGILGVGLFTSSKALEKQIAQISAEAEDEEKEKSSVLAKHGLESAQEYIRLKREKENEENEALSRKAAIDMARRIYENQKSEYDAAYKKICDKYGNIDGAVCEKPSVDENLSVIQAEIDKEILIFTAESAKIKSSAEAANTFGEISDISQELADCTAELDDANEKLRVLNLALEILSEAYEELKSNFAPRLARSAAQIFNTVTGKKYGELIVNDAFEIQIKKDGKYENAEFFSSGTIQQLYFALRLGIIELTLENSPLFLDDSFIAYDDGRFAETVSFLKDYAKKHQIILCTCHERECGAADNLLKF